MALQEREFFTEKQETRTEQYTCPRCRRQNEFKVRWVKRLKKDRLPPGADERDRALYGKLRDYMVRMDDMLACPTCRQRFEIPSHHSMVFLQPGE